MDVFVEEKKPWKPQEILGKIDRETIKKAEATLQEYMRCKKSLDSRIVSNEQWWKMRHWEEMRTKSANKNDPQPSSAWLFNSIINKHADFMDNYPEANILPREESDKDTAQMLSSVIPCILEQNKFEDVYNKESYYKLKMGLGIYGVFWNSSKQNGLGDIDIKKIDVLKIFWESGIDDIQDSKNIFVLELMDNDTLKSLYPQMADKTSDGTLLEAAKYIHDDQVDTTDKSIVVDWYYKKVVKASDGELPIIKTVLHYCKFCNGEVLYASENDETMQDGWYKHGKYPFVVDEMFPVEGSLSAFGYIDIMKDCQMYIDKMDQAIIKNAYLSSKPRYLSKISGGINEEEFTDLSKDIIHYQGDPDSIKPVETPQIPSSALQVRQNKVDELKETSGNRDFSQGSTTSGVTAASAIAALQEAGSKLSRDMIKTSYNCFSEVVYLVIELIRQFYDVRRTFRITNKLNQEEFVSIDNSNLNPQSSNEFGMVLNGRVPYFDVTVKAQKASPFSKISQNELAKELYGMGFFNPELADQALACLDMMMFDGREEIMRKIENNGTLFQRLQQAQATMAQMASVIAQSTGDTRLLDALGQQEPTAQPKKGSEQSMEDITNESMNSTAGKARERAASAATPKV